MKYPDHHPSEQYLPYTASVTTKRPCVATLIHYRRGNYNRRCGFYVLDDDALVYKKLRTGAGYYVLARLLIPAGAVVYITDWKCRASEALVLDMHRIQGTRREVKRAMSLRDFRFVYRKGQFVTPVPSNYMYPQPEEYQLSASYNSCASGIHFFVKQSHALSFTM